MKLKKPIIYVNLYVAILSLQSGCANLLPVNSFCQIYQPIYMSEADTAETKKQIDNNNAVWLELCD